VVASAVTAAAAPAQSPQARVDELLAADRAFSVSGAGTDLVTSISAMLADDVIMPAPPGRLVRGKTDAVASLKANAANAQSKVTWTPLRGGISADGLHGFTFGTMTVRRPDGTANPAKYLSYWVKGAAGWRVAAYKRVPSGAGDAPTALMAPSLPTAMVAPATNVATIEQHRASVVAAEKAFSDRAQKIGLGPAFREFGSADAINLGGQSGPGVVVGNEAIAKLVQGDSPVTDGRVHWSADTAFVASSGDLGVTFGFIKRNGEPAGGGAGASSGATAGSPFFTIWRRAGPGAPWKYMAE
jgi:ketosteroid isomerase-like protein